MLIYSVVASGLTVAYILLFAFYIKGWLGLSEFIPAEKNFGTRVSIIIPARNEESTIGNLLTDLLNQNYPAGLLEIIVVDDFSEDSTSVVAASFSPGRIRVIHLKDCIGSGEKIFSYKKKSLEAGIAASAGELIITTDADCRVNSAWLSTIVDFYETTGCHMILGPVMIKDEKNFFEKFQSLDLIGMAGITGATIRMMFPTMCNGANLAFRKKSFYDVNGYYGISEITSGDDMLLMHKMANRWNDGVLFLKNQNAAVFTLPQLTVKSYIRQRMRWASKSASYSDIKITVNLLLVYLFNVSVLTSLVLLCIMQTLIAICIFQVVLKLILDFIFLNLVSKYYERKKLMYLFLPIEILHIFYIAVIGFAGNLFKVKWKGRMVQ
ncbi:MAG: glycosyltransferase [Chitinophagales bacterium]